MSKFSWMPIIIEREAAATSEATALIAELDAILGAGYEQEQRHGLSVEQVFQPNIRFFIARINDAAMGCGAIALIEDYAEIKRMYTREAARGRGVAEAVLARLEDEARAAGKSVLRLETGTLQHAAIRLYERCGFRRCRPFGHYSWLPPHRIAASLFYEKSLE